MNITNKITLILLVLFLLVTNSIAGRYAEGLSFSSGINFENAILIEDVDDLIKLSKDYNNWDKYYKQTADIIFADSLKQDWGWDDNGEKTNGFRPIGTSSYPFSGGYDGGGYVIDNLYINANDDDDDDDIRSGLFYRVESSGQDTVYIKNINIGSNSKIISDLMWTAFPVSGALIAYGTGNIFVDSCSSSAEVSTYDVIESQDTLSSGGLIGNLSRATITISNSINKGNIRTTSKIINYAFSGGLIGYSKESNITINNSTNSGNIVALSDKYSACGGLIGGGRDYSVIRIDKSTNNGNVSCGYNGDLTTTSWASTSAGYSAGFIGVFNGMISGNTSSITITNSINNANITSSSSSSNNSGFIAKAYFVLNISITNSINNGKIFSTRLEDSNVYSSSKNSGFITSLYNNTPSTLKISNSVNNGGIVSYLVSPYSAGFIASLNSMFATTITNCMNSGSISSFSGTSYSGGFVGYIPESELNLLVEIKNSINSGSVSSRSSHSSSLYSYSGGFVAYSNGVLRITNSINKGSSSAINKYASYSINAGFVGKTENSFELINSVNTGSSYYDGIFTKALVGNFENTLEITNSFFDYETSNFLASENNAVGNDVDSLYVDLGKTFENFKEETFFGVDIFTTSASDDNPWVFNTTGGRPYLYWEKMAISNSKLMSDINNNSIDLSLVDVNNSDEINATEMGLKYCYFDEDNIIKEEYCTHAESNNNIVTLEIDTLDYRIQPYAKLSDDSYVYGDMLAYSSDEYKIVQITLNTSAVIKASQEITFTDLITEVDLSQTQAYTIVASSTSSEVVAFTSLSEDVCEVSGSEITFKTIGTCKIKAEVSENDDYLSSQEIFEIHIDYATNTFVKTELNFHPVVVEIYTLKGEYIKSKYCPTLSEYRVLINSIESNQKFIVR